MNGATLFRLLAWAFALTLLALPVVGVLNGSFASDRWPLRHLELKAELRRVSAEQIQRTAMQFTGEGFFALSLTELRDALAKLPWVESVEVRKRWPDTVVVKVLEFQPYAIWDGRALVSRSGRLFEVPGIEALGGLPRLGGPDAGIEAVVAFHAEAVRALESSRLQVAQVHLSDRGSWTVVLDGGAELVLGRHQAMERLQRFADTVDTLMQTRPEHVLRHADLRYPNGYALTWSERAPPSDGGGDASAQARAAGSNRSADIRQDLQV
ncbi:cell division protein FtsQ/DivIB [Pseudofulvimonas gallinarii]|jgi:cell division protein FtsQ|uniref:Cell division protein FtsQ n=1 Tax=Pseudofulvimonas gallinarii TaxID=634155 RepID=A0A4R3LEX2_9GAMM|nr:cell division protein FtsQ/DivIB [Pseudofulvimonas gallinarii]TCS97958.1 cell division protein FtsQ [Pseudofulvimonas gallinarii]THD13113.1 hypothetical protein B1808_09545 [Pseudofulvimonas gallinarii]